MTHKLTGSGLININTGMQEHCYHKQGLTCDPVLCIGAEVLEKVERTLIPDGYGKPQVFEKHNRFRRIKFYCMPQCREIVLSD